MLYKLYTTHVFLCPADAQSTSVLCFLSMDISQYNHILHKDTDNY